jgi:predicted ATPase
LDILILNDPLLFSKLLLDGRVHQYKESENKEIDIIFFDRGIPDINAYMDHSKLKYPNIFREKSTKYRYHTIFILPPWKEIYITDDERYESYELSISIYKNLVNTYSDLNYKIIEVPKDTVNNRIDFILKSI